ncbi:hypothetical protein IC757_11790 [Wenzhouxiangella sp. AB-CW3]|uniref:hypothetical protein n=1 Tax=Wenzhouxiangella sp. AB-CW3 TaxID=2771012 RepID=UPI00168AD48D|nr:hypothetical protein [Wenzhouxiangella sp. AB-CW3]QOC21718.1 hypothetical protein IC757_11790 [Wenzhouxiangella sp. AB-CW3]
MKPTTLAILLAALIMVGCSRDDDRPEPAAPEVNAGLKAELFERIDADAAYLMANLEPLPEDISERIWDMFGPMAEGNREAYEAMPEAYDHPLLAALVEELVNFDSREAFEARGLHGNGLWAVHSLSLFPVLHWQLTDAAAFSAMLERIGENAGVALPWREIDDAEVLWIEMGDFGLALRHDEYFVTAALIPDDSRLLRRVADLERPTTAYTPSDLSRFNEERGFLPQTSGFLEFGRLFERLLDDDDELAGPVHLAAGVQGLLADPACDAELRTLVSQMPRISTGYYSFEDGELYSGTKFETDPALGERLAKIADAPVSLEGDAEAMFSFGLAFNLVAARDFVRDMITGWVDNPPQCELFAGIRDNASEWQLAVNRPIPPMVTNLQGVRARLDRAVIGQDMKSVEDASGSLAVFMRNPQMIVGMAQMFSPELAAVSLEPGGEPQRLPEGIVPDTQGVSAWIAMGDNALGVALGEEQKDQLMHLLEPGEAGSAIAHVGIDFAAYGRLMEDMMSEIQTQLEDADTELELGDDEEMFRLLAEIYGYSDFSLHLTTAGVEIKSRVQLRD